MLGFSVWLVKLAPVAALTAVFLGSAIPGTQYCTLMIRWTGNIWVASCADGGRCDAGKSCLVAADSSGDEALTVWSCKCCTAPETGCTLPLESYCHGQLGLSEAGWTVSCVKYDCFTECWAYEGGIPSVPPAPMQDPTQACYCVGFP
jgi:hypothetical protein